MTLLNRAVVTETDCWTYEKIACRLLYLVLTEVSLQTRH